MNLRTWQKIILSILIVYTLLSAYLDSAFDPSPDPIATVIVPVIFGIIVYKWYDIKEKLKR